MTKAQFFTFVDNTLPDNIVGSISASDLRLALKNLAGQLYDDYAAAADNTGQGPRQLWLKPATGTTGLANSDDVYHNGSVILGSSASPTEKLQVVGNMLLSGIVKLATAFANRKITLYDVNNNDHQFYGFGANSGILRLQVPDTASSFVWYAGTSSSASNELMRLVANGRLGIGNPAPRRALDVNGEIVTTLRMTLAYDTTSVSPTWHMDNYGDAFRVFRQGNIDGGGGNTFLLLSNTGFFAVGANMGNATSTLHVKGTTGHQQLRLETSYTPTSTADTNGAVGQIAWDTNYFYVKTTAGWKRSALSTF